MMGNGVDNVMIDFIRNITAQCFGKALNFLIIADLLR